jgi:hypothetical protein
LACRGIVAVCVPNTLNEETGTKKGLYVAVQFQMFVPHRTDFLNLQRTVAVTNDGGRWRFDANGAVQPFEETERYKPGFPRLTSQAEVIDLQ